MAGDKKQKEAKEYKTTEEETTSYLSEPFASYGSMPFNAAVRTVGIMGMGGKKDFATVKSESDLINLIRTGIPRQAMDNLMVVADLSLNEMAAIVHTSDRTLRRYTPDQKLSQEQSERMIEMAKLYSRGEEVLGSLGEFRQWMDTELHTFGNKRPKEFLDTSLGITMIMEELGRIQHGIFA
ncbi:type II RES/Xre toxin-antitoxin system antitoxin [Nemorincola caseinilytica]